MGKASNIKKFMGHTIPSGAEEFGSANYLIDSDLFYKDSGTKVFYKGGWKDTISNRNDLIKLPIYTTPIKEIIIQYKSYYAAAKALKVTATQLSRLCDLDAMVADNGEVWIRSKTVLYNFNKAVK
jgi:hypothetical protein